MSSRQIIVGCVATLMLIGLVMVYTNTAVARGINPLENRPVTKHLTWVLLSVAALIFFAHVDYHDLARHSRLIMLLTLAGLVAVLLFGARLNGAKRWFRLGPFSFQVSEVAKIAIILYIAGFISRKREALRDFGRGFLPPIIVLAVTFGLIMLQPDFGTAALIGAVVLTLLVVAGARPAHVGSLVALALPVLFLLVRMREYRWRRMIVFLDPWADPQGAGYHVVQSLIALACGGWAGAGAGRGLQQYGFLPEAETDFVFSIVGQETGFVGCVLLMGVFVALVYTGMRVARSAPDTLGAVLAAGVTILIGYQMLINVGVAASALPTKGISLPFVSFGGSSLLALSAGVGIVLNVSRHCPREAGLRVRGATRKEAVA